MIRVGLSRLECVLGTRAIAAARRIELLLGAVGALALGAGCQSRGKPTQPSAHSVLSAHSAGALPPAKPDQHETLILTQALQKKPNHVPVLLRLASLASQSGKRNEAERYLREALTVEPSNAEARLELGKVLFEVGKVQEALSTTEAILKTQPNNPDALYNLGAIHGNLGNTKQALEYWNRLLASDPDSASGRRAKQLMAELQASSR